MIIHADSILVPIIGTGLFIAAVAVALVLALDWLLDGRRAAEPDVCPDCLRQRDRAHRLRRRAMRRVRRARLTTKHARRAPAC